MIWNEGCRVWSDHRHYPMRHFWHALHIGWAAFQEELELHAASRDRAARQRARIRAMTDEELLRCSIQWGGAVCYPELRRRGLPVPGEVTSA